jgi:hypothetical protein
MSAGVVWWRDGQPWLVTSFSYVTHTFQMTSTRGLPASMRVLPFMLKDGEYAELLAKLTTLPETP